MKNFLFILLLLLSLASYSQKPLAQKQNVTPGTYLIKAKNKMLIGAGAQFLAGGLILVGSSVSSTETYYTGQGYEIPHTYIRNKGLRDVCYIGAGVLGAAGLYLQLSGIVQIGKAGLSLNENGIGVKVKF